MLSRNHRLFVHPSALFSSSSKSRFGRPTVSPRPCKVRPHVLHRPCSPCTREGLFDCHFLFAITQTPIRVPLDREQPQKRKTPQRSAQRLKFLQPYSSFKEGSQTVHTTSSQGGGSSWRGDLPALVGSLASLKDRSGFGDKKR